MNIAETVSVAVGLIVIATTLLGCLFFRGCKEKNCHTDAVMSYKIDKGRTQGLVKVTENGEICYDYETKEFVVFEETYAYEVGRTCYPQCALDMFKAYCEEYL